MTRGKGSDANPVDGDRATIEVAIRDGRIVVTATSFAGCDTGRLATLALGRLAQGKTAEAAFAISVAELLIAIGYVPSENERCVLTAIGALRSALIDAQVAALAEATIEAKKLSLK